MKKILFIIGAIFALAGCMKDDLSLEASDLLVNFTTANSITRAEEKSTWSAGDQIGIYAANSLDALKYTNVPYTASGTTGTISFDPASEKIYYTSYSNNTKFVAYYPYYKEVSSTEIPIDLEAAQDDLLVSGIVEQSQSAGNVALTFNHALTLVEITVSASDEFKSLDDLNVFITGSYTEGSYELMGQILTVDATQGHVIMDVALEDEDETVTATVTAFVMPSDYSGATDPVIIYFEIAGRTFYKELNPDWDAAYKYSYSAKMGDDYFEFSEVGIEAWETDVTADSDSSLVDIYYNSSDSKYYRGLL